jgi:hypothetical protein
MFHPENCKSPLNNTVPGVAAMGRAGISLPSEKMNPGIAGVWGAVTTGTPGYSC